MKEVAFCLNELLKRGVQSGYTPLVGVWGYPPDLFFPPFLARKGGRGMVEGVPITL